MSLLDAGYPRPYPAALRCVRPRPDVLGHRHHPHAVLVAPVLDHVHGRAAVAVGPGRGADHGSRRLRLALLEPSGLIEVASRWCHSSPTLSSLFLVKSPLPLFLEPATPLGVRARSRVS